MASGGISASAILWVIGALVSFMGMAVATRQLSHAMGTFEILFFRSLVGLVVLLPLIAARWPRVLDLSQFRLHLARNTVHFAAQYCWTVGIALLPLAEVFALEFTMPIWVALLAAWVLKERIGRARLIAVAGGFLGVLIVVRPGAAVFDPAALIVLLAALGYAASIVMVKLLTRTGSALAVVFWMTVVQLPMGFAATLFQWSTPRWDSAPWILLLGITGLSAHYALAQALRTTDASIILPVDFLRVPLIALVGFLLYGEALDALVFVGAAVIFLSNYYAVLAERRAP